MTEYSSRLGDKEITVECNGHTGVRGSSLICAGISTLMYTFADRTRPISAETGDGRMKFTVKNNSQNRVYLDFLNAGISILAKKYPDDVKIL